MLPITSPSEYKPLSAYTWKLPYKTVIEAYNLNKPFRFTTPYTEPLWSTSIKVYRPLRTSFLSVSMDSIGKLSNKSFYDPPPQLVALAFHLLSLQC